MHGQGFFAVATIVVGLSTMPAFGQTAGAVQPAAGKPAAMPTMQTPADQAMMGGMDKMNETMKSAVLTGNADRDFVTMMMPHHQAAVDMAKAELQYGTDAKLRKMARDIILSQDKEIVEMKRWQAAHQ